VLLFELSVSKKPEIMTTVKCILVLRSFGYAKMYCGIGTDVCEEVDIRVPVNV
jgi:hypothetical protein